MSVVRRPHVAALLAMGAGLASAPAAVAVDQLTLRPAYTRTTFLNFEPVEAIGGEFFELIRRGIAQADGVEAAAARWHAERYGTVAAEAQLLPSLSLYGETGLATGIGGGSAPYAYGVRVSMPIYDGNSRRLAADAQSSTAEAARQAAMDELTATLVDLVAAAAGVQRAERIWRIRQAQFTAAKDLLVATTAERTTGTATRVDTDQAQAQVDQAELELRLAEAARAEAREAFGRITGQDPGHIGAIGSIAAELPTDIGTAVKIALEANPQLGQRLDLAQAAAFSHRSAAAALGPELSVELSAGGSGDLASAVSDPVAARAMLKFELPFSFDGDARVRRKAFERQAADLEASAARNGVVAGVEGAFLRLQATRTALVRAREVEASTAAVAEGMEVERELGERSLLDVVNARTANFNARVRVAELRYDLIVAEHLLAAQIGRLADIYGVSLDNVGSAP